MQFRAAAALLVALAALTGCTAPAPPAPSGATPPGPPDGVTVVVTQQRSDVAGRQAELRIHNGSDAPLEVGEVRLDDPRFAASATRVVPRTSALAAGATADIRVQLPDAACPGGADPISTVTFDYETGGRSGTAVVAAPELFPFLDEVHRRDCVAQAVAAAGDVSFGIFTPSSPSTPATLELTIAPSTGKAGADAAVTLVDIRETNLLTFEGLADGVLPLGDSGIRVDGAARSIPLRILPARCDPHAVQENKRGTVFAVDVVVDGEAGQFLLAAPPDLTARLLTWVSDWCAG